MSEPEPQEVCEICQEPVPVMCTLPFKRGKNRRVCPFCLARSIQAETGFRLVPVLARMFEARATAPAVSAAYKAAAAELRAEAAEAAGV